MLDWVTPPTIKSLPSKIPLHLGSVTINMIKRLWFWQKSKICLGLLWMRVNFKLTWSLDHKLMHPYGESQTIILQTHKVLLGKARVHHQRSLYLTIPVSQWDFVCLSRSQWLQHPAPVVFDGPVECIDRFPVPEAMNNEWTHCHPSQIRFHL